MIPRNKFSLAVVFVALLSACGGDSRKTDDTAAVASADTPALTVPPAPETTTGGSMLDPNAASAAELAAVPGLNATVASSIVSGRPHANMVAVNRLLPRTLTDQQRDSVYARIWKPIDLNKATDEEILLIPGVGSRMLHEFKEYRPYTSIEQFRREIGKYVDKTELARLEQYVARP
jgi:DNA uptake protein ComE-like DNA-binding protein